MKRLTYDTVKQKALDCGCKILTSKSDYENTRTRVKYKCLNCGSISETVAGNLYGDGRNGYCMNCRPKGGEDKIEFSDEEKKEITKRYKNGDFITDIVEDYRGSWPIISRVIEESEEVYKKSYSEISKLTIEKYGATPGFSGKSHSEESKRKISKGVQKAHRNGELEVNGGNCEFYETVIGKVQGRYEVAYIQSNLDNKPEIPKNPVETPFGFYYPDFEYEEKYIEVKSPFTLEVCKGDRKGRSGEKDNTQWKKIQWTDENKKEVEVVVLEESKVSSLFQQAKKEVIL